MSLEEARSVLWLRNNHRPLGELLDEGYLDRKRLQWAAERAYDARLKAAAAVLLEHLERSSDTTPIQPSPAPPPSAPSPIPVIAAGVTVEQARATLWPFKPHKGEPMGVLVDARRLSLKDLVYAIEHAWDDRVRRAAVVLLTLRLGQVVQEPPPPAGLLRVVSGGRSFAERKQLRLTMIEGVIMGVFFGACLVLALQSLIRAEVDRSGRPLAEILATPAGIIAAVIVLALVAALGLLPTIPLNLILRVVDKQIENYRRGQEGEEQVIEALRQNLDGNWTLFRNIVLPGRRRTDIDAVLVGPPGVWALEVKTFSGEYRNVGEHWEVRAGRRWKLLRKSPSRQAQDNAARLANFFRADGLHQWVTPVVVWVDDESTLTVENPMVAVWPLDRLPEELGNVWGEREMSEERRRRIAEKLSALCRQENKTSEVSGG